MKRILRFSILSLLAGLFVVPVMAQQTYTNADLGKLHIPGAYTNKDLKALKPLPVQRAPLFELPRADLSRWLEQAAIREARRQRLVYARDRLQAELDYELDRLEQAYSPAGGGFTGSLRPGLRSKLEGKLEYLRREIFLLNRDIAAL